MGIMATMSLERFAAAAGRSDKWSFPVAPSEPRTSTALW
jgi:hypothetical protein